MIARITAQGEILLAAEGAEAEAEGAEAHAGEDTAHNPILPVTSELVYATISFFVLLFAMWKFLVPAVVKGMRDRSDTIRDNLDEAERTKAEASRILEEYQRQLADAKGESARIIDEARAAAEQMRQDLMARAEAEVAELRSRNADDLQAAQGRAMADLRVQVKQLALELAEVVVQKNIDRAANDALLEKFIDEVGAKR